MLTVVAAEHRSQLRNREAARERLAGLLAEATAPARRPPPDAPHGGVPAARLDAKTRRGAIKRLRGRPDEYSNGRGADERGTGGHGTMTPQ